MPKTKPQFVEQNPAEASLYTPWDAARYLHISLWSVWALSGQFRGWPIPEWFFFYFFPDFPVPWQADGNGASPALLSEGNRFNFCRFADLFVRAAAFDLLVTSSHVEEQHKDRWKDLYHAILRGLQDVHREPIYFGGEHTDEHLDAFIKPYAQRLEDEQRALLRKWFALRLERVDVKEGVPIRIYPFSRDPAESSPRLIVLDPRIRFGRPTIAERGVPTDSLFQRYQAGDSVAELAEDYGLTVVEVEEAIRYESLPSASPFSLHGW